MNNSLLLLIISWAPLLMSAVETKTINGIGIFSDETITVPLKVFGPIKAKALEATTIEGFGPASFTNNSHVGDITIHGPLTITDSSVMGKAKVFGSIKATNATFSDSLQATGSDIEIELTNTTVEDITITIQQPGITKKRGFFSFFYSSTPPKEPRVLLRGTTLVKGSITFLGGQGTVSKDDGAEIKGIVHGATTVTHKEEEE